LPFAANISAALESATLRPDLSQELSGVYASTNPAAYPISAYSYIVTQCSQSADRQTCRGPYANPGVAETLSQWMRYIACDGQRNMADIGYSPLPINLSQEIANSIGRMNGTAAEVLTPDNCANPRFRNEPLPGSPPDPLQNVDPGALGAGGALLGGGSAQSGAAGGAGSANAAGSETSESAVGEVGEVRAVGGGSTDTKPADPVEFDGDNESLPVALPLAALVGLMAGPPMVASIRQRRNGGGAEPMPFG
jgi:phosphate transport system substrate-binding protein